MTGPEARCPKSMVHGPCGGVTDQGCEVDGRPCPFVTAPAVGWHGAPMTPRAVDLPEVVVDLRPQPDDPEFDASVAVLCDAGVGGLVGEHVDDRSDIASPDLVRAVTGRGLPTIATVTCRNRSAVDCREQIARMVDAGAAAVLCVTGDHPAARFGAGHTASFELDGTRLAAVARSTGHAVAVAESPASAPVDGRPTRLLTKQQAGADLAILNHAGDVEDLVRFADQAAALGVSLALVAPVPVVTDPGSLRALTQFPGVHLPAAFTAPPPGFDGVGAAVALGRRLLASGRFEHVNLSGRATTDGQLARSRVMAEVATGILRR